MGIENPVHLAFIAIVALLVLGPRRLPELARALGRGIREFRDAVNQPDGQQLQVPPAQPPAVAGEAVQEPVEQGDLVQEPVVHGTLVQEPVVHGTVVQVPAEPEPPAPEPVVQDAVVVAETVGPTRPLRSGDAPDRRPL